MKNSNLSAVRLFPFALALAAGFAAGWMANRPTDRADRREAPAELDLGDKVRVGVSDPIADRYEVQELEVVRIIAIGEPDQFAPNGRIEEPRAEWRFAIGHRTYFCVPTGQ